MVEIVSIFESHTIQFLRYWQQYHDIDISVLKNCSISIIVALNIVNSRYIVISPNPSFVYWLN